MIKLEHINKAYHSKNNKKNEELVLHDVNLLVNDGDFIAIVGPSGSGKSTLINIIGLLDNSYSGNYIFDGEEINNLSDDVLSKVRNQRIGFVFQDFKLLPKYTVSENIKLPSIYSKYSKNFNVSNNRVLDLLKMVELDSKANEYPNNLSGGQKQRIAMARALINNPSIIIADEPTGALDSRTSKNILQVLKSINAQGKTIIMVTHSAEAAEYANRKLNMVDGVLVEV